MKRLTMLFASLALVSLNVLADQPRETSIDWASEEAIAPLIEFKLDTENGEITYGPNFAFSDKMLSDNFSEIYLVRAINHQGDDQYILYITAQYNDKEWRSYKNAKIKGGLEVKLVAISQNENVCERTNCRYEERLAIPISYITIFTSANMGMNLTIDGNSSYNIILPSSYFKAILDAAPQEGLYDRTPAAAEEQKI
ncbi:MAG: hypothetical protein R3E57_03510 [Porticoccaceae bacterium]